ncbi:MAG TPA: phenylacetate--CoA ligase [Thermoleophilia bacterium]|nr:phenylacetate--CoA ligase [Thermoleophilia bacterium]
MNQVWNPEYEMMGREELRDLQFKRLQMSLRWAVTNVPLYRDSWQSMGLKPQDIRSLDDLAKIPFTTKDHFKQCYPYGLFAVPLERVVRVHASTGTMSRPTVVGYTRGDLNTWAELCARVVMAGGARPQDVAQVAFGYGLQTGAFGLHHGLERIGAMVIPASTGNTRRQLTIMRDYRTTVLVCTPSYAMYMAEAAHDFGFDIGELGLRVGLFGAEPWTNRVREELERRLGVTASDNYGLSEVIGPGVSGECVVKEGLHINEDHFIVEVVDPETGKSLPEGTEGELVFTSLTKEAVPVLRYRTGDLASVSSKPCACGRTLARHSKVYARTDDMIIVRGVNVFPSQVEEVLLEVEGVEPHFQIVLDRKGKLDEMVVQIEVDPAFLPDAMRRLVEFERHVEDRLQEELGVRARVKLVEPKSVPRHTGKARRVVDHR